MRVKALVDSQLRSDLVAFDGGATLASSLNNSAGSKMANIQHCRDGEKG